MRAVGSIVRSLCGRDSKRVFMIVGELSENTSGTVVLVADGRLRKLQSPKKKNLRHLAVLAAAKDGETSVFKGDNSELCRIISSFEAAGE